MLETIIAALALTLVPIFGGLATPAHSAVTVSNCGDQEIEPDFLMIACADGGNYVEHLKWSSWSARMALGTGIEQINDCEPSCAGGKFHSYPVSVRLDRVRSGQFARMQMTYTGHRPPHVRRVVSYNFYNRE